MQWAQGEEVVRLVLSLICPGLPRGQRSKYNIVSRDLGVKGRTVAGSCGGLQLGKVVNMDTGVTSLYEFSLSFTVSLSLFLYIL